MRIGVIGPAEDGHDDTLREAAEFLLGDAEMDRTIYLGVDDAVSRVVRAWSAEVMGGEGGSFLDRAAHLAQNGTPAEIEQLLEADAKLRRLSTLRQLPRPPARAIEMVEDRIVTVVHDKAVLDEEDIANAHVIVYGKSDGPLLKRFGPRCFFTPGPLSERRVGILEVEPDGRMAVGLYDLSGKAIWREALQGRAAKIMVSS